MNPRIVVLNGPLEGKTFALDREAFSIGRHSDNDLQVLEAEISRRHCEILRAGARFRLRDHDSRHGTFINTLPVQERGLEHGDLISLGATALLFLLDDTSEVAARSSSTASDFVARTTLQLRLEDVPYLRRRLRHARLGGAEAAADRVAGDLQTLLEISTAMHALRRQDVIAERLLELALEALPADRGSVLLVGPDADEELLRVDRDRRAQSCEAFALSRALLRQVLEERLGLLSNDVASESSWNGEGEPGAAVRAVLCVPLLGRRRPLGALYLDADATGVSFERTHLELLTAAAHIASLALENAGYCEWLEGEKRRLQEEHLEHDIVGESPAIQKALAMIQRVAPTDSTVLIRGESGTGKELVAQAIHRSSARADGPFIAINCATLSESLLESELFGHEKGAFTGAVRRKIGKVEAAQKGTLFLDEVGELTPRLQAKLLRVLQERELERVGGGRPIPVDVRVIAATNRDLERALREGTFRDDLYYRLNVIAFVLPPLRERGDDTALLARYFARRHSERLNRRVVGLTPEARRCLTAYDWPGNVRQLSNVIERAVVLGEDELIRPEDLPEEILERTAEEVEGYQAALTRFKKKLVIEAFEQAGSDHGAAAEVLGIHANSLHRLIRNLGLRDEIAR